jgi:outer membrane lipoprotein
MAIQAATLRGGISSPSRIASGWLRLLLASALVLCAGCATSPISKPLREAAKPQPSFAEINARPEAYRNRPVLLGGVIVETKNQPQATEIEVLQKPLERSDRPEDVDRSHGRFLVRCNGFLDPAVYAQGREITVAGEVQGQEARPLDQTQYTYPVISCREIHLWAKRPPAAYYYPAPYWYGPWYGGWPGYYYPYGYPYWW